MQPVSHWLHRQCRHNQSLTALTTQTKCRHNADMMCNAPRRPQDLQSESRPPFRRSPVLHNRASHSRSQLRFTQLSKHDDVAPHEPRTSTADPDHHFDEVRTCTAVRVTYILHARPVRAVIRRCHDMMACQAARVRVSGCADSCQMAHLLSDIMDSHLGTDQKRHLPRGASRWGATVLGARGV